MKLFIPVVGTQLVLTEPATVLIKNAGQNERYAKALGAGEGEHPTITLPEGTLLTVDRVYIRQGDAVEYNSLTFKIKANAKAKLPAGRFFLSVDVVNTLHADIALEKPSTDALDLYQTYRNLWRESSYSERVSGQPFERLLTMAKISPTLAEGDVQLRIQDECNLLTETIALNSKEVGVDSFLTLVEQIERAGNEQHRVLLAARLRTIREQLDAVQEAPSHDACESLYAFRLFRFNGQPALWLKTLGETPFLRRLHIAEDAYKLIFELWFESRAESPKKAAELNWGSAIAYLRPEHPWSQHRESFGVLPYNRNISPKEPVIDMHYSQAILPADAFSDNILTRTKHADHGHQFFYRLTSGERLTPAQLRKLK